MGEVKMMIRRLIVLGALVLLGVGGWVVYYSSTFHVVSTTPKNHGSISTYGAVVVNFSQALPSNSGVNQITLSPSVVGQSTTQGKTLTFVPANPLTSGKTYRAVLSNITSGNGKHLADVSLTFSVVTIPFSKLPKADQDRYVSHQDQQFDATTPLNKFRNSLPYQTSQYNLSYNSVNTSYTVQTLDSQTDTDEQAALAYIKTFGVDPATLTITYAVPAIYSGHPGP
jgi:hypothetical protein